jgi:hypothetical protein
VHHVEAGHLDEPRKRQVRAGTVARGGEIVSGRRALILAMKSATALASMTAG